jgi:hypothetical protein
MKKTIYCCHVNSLSLRDAYRDVGGRAKQVARAERVGERGYLYR